MKNVLDKYKKKRKKKENIDIFSSHRLVNRSKYENRSSQTKISLGQYLFSSFVSVDDDEMIYLFFISFIGHLFQENTFDQTNDNELLDTRVKN